MITLTIILVCAVILSILTGIFIGVWWQGPKLTQSGPEWVVPEWAMTSQPATVSSNRIQELETAIRKHRDQRWDDRCWRDDLELYEHLPEGVGQADLRLAPPEEQLANCRKFVECRHHGTEYVSPMREIEQLEREVQALRDFRTSLEGKVSRSGPCP